jgi:hypothetical protein
MSLVISIPRACRTTFPQLAIARNLREEFSILLSSSYREKVQNCIPARKPKLRENTNK